MSRRPLALAVCTLAAFAVVGAAGAAWAHPLGNFTQNTYAGLTVHPDGVHVDYVLDLAEIPALQARQSGLDADGDGTVAAGERQEWATGRCGSLADGVGLRVGGRPLRVDGAPVSLRFPAGEAGLRTLRLECELTSGRVELAGQQRLGPTAIRFRDANLPGRIGWREVTAVGRGVTVASSDVPERSLSDRLRAYPKDRLERPLARSSAELAVRPGGGEDPRVREPVAIGAPAQLDRMAGAFTALVARRDLTPTFALLAVTLALALGALHALAPGHGKTVMAAYVVSRQGSTSSALQLGATVAAAHTTGVVALGVIVSATQAVAPDRLYPWLGAVSGLLFATVGASMLRRVRRDPSGHRYSHGGDTRHAHGHGHHRRPGGGWREMVVPGLAGGLVPSPSALLVLLGGIALGRAWFGLLLVLAYGLGLAAALVGAGLLLVHARAGLTRRLGANAWAGRLAAGLPQVTACLILAGGLVLTLRSLAALR